MIIKNLEIRIHVQAREYNSSAAARYVVFPVCSHPGASCYKEENIVWQLCIHPAEAEYILFISHSI